MTTFDATYSYPTIVSFNSKDRTSGTNSSFISNPVDLGLNRFDSVCLMTASIPKSYYNMPTGYNTFTLTEKNVSTTITIPVGSYNKINLASTLSTLLTAGSVTLGNNWTYVVTNPPTTGADTFKFTFTVSGNGLFQPTITMTSSSPFRQLGFEELTAYPFVANTLVSVNAINLAYVLRMFIKSNVCDTATDGILAEILSVGSFPPQSVIFFQEFNIDLNTRVFNATNINSWQFTIVDSYGQEIDFLGIPWAFTLVFYKRNDTHEIHKTELMITNEQRLFNIDQAQRRLIESVKKTEKEKETETEKSETKTSEVGTTELAKSDEMNPTYPVLSNYIIPELVEPLDHLGRLNL
jgi:hypothetical protein